MKHQKNYDVHEGTKFIRWKVVAGFGHTLSKSMNRVHMQQVTTLINKKSTYSYDL
jgi:hypothetical protein